MIIRKYYDFLYEKIGVNPYIERVCDDLYEYILKNIKDTKIVYKNNLYDKNFCIGFITIILNNNGNTYLDVDSIIKKDNKWNFTINLDTNFNKSYLHHELLHSLQGGLKGKPSQAINYLKTFEFVNGKMDKPHFKRLERLFYLYNEEELTARIVQLNTEFKEYVELCKDFNTKITKKGLDTFLESTSMYKDLIFIETYNPLEIIKNKNAEDLFNFIQEIDKLNQYKKEYDFEKTFFSKIKSFLYILKGISKNFFNEKEDYTTNEKKNIIRKYLKNISNMKDYFLVLYKRKIYRLYSFYL